MSSFVAKQPSELKMFTTPASRALFNRLETGAHLILIGLLSLGLWAAVWAVVTSLI
jgi:urea transporter